MQNPGETYPVSDDTHPSFYFEDIFIDFRGRAIDPDRGPAPGRRCRRRGRRAPRWTCGPPAREGGGKHGKIPLFLNTAQLNVADFVSSNNDIL